MPQILNMIYLGRSRLHRNRANLIQTLQTASGFEQLGWNVTVVLPPWPKSISLSRVLKQLDVNPAPVIESSQLLHPRWKFWPFIRFFHHRLAKAEIVYTRVPRISLSLSRAGITHCLEIHNLKAIQNSGSITSIIRSHQEGLIRVLISISAGAAAALVHEGAVPERVVIAPSGVKWESYSEPPPFMPENILRPTVVHLGRLTSDRGLNIFRHLAKNDICDILVISSDDIHVTGIESLPPITHCEVPKWLAKTNLVLLPYQSTIDTVDTMSPVKMFEAMAAGKPIIASDLPTLREVLRHEENALLVTPEDPTAWTAAIRRLQQDPDLANRIAATARADARQFSWYNRSSHIANSILKSIRTIH